MSESAEAATASHPPGAVDLVVEDDLLYVRGQGADIERVLASLSIEPDSTGMDVLSSASGLGAVGASLAAATTLSETCLRLTPEAKQLVERYGFQPSASGAIRGFVRSDNRIAGQLSFETVSLGAEQALALQNAAVSLALRTAIADVRSAVEQVDRKVSDLQARVRAREIGEVIGSYRTLEQVVAATQARGHLLEADWDACAGAGRELTQALESLRSYVTQRIDALTPSGSLTHRADQVDSLTKPDGLPGALQLILVAEQSLHLWEWLKLERVRVTDPEHAESALQDARESLRAQHSRDRALAARAHGAIDQARVIGPLDLNPFARNTIERASAGAMGEVESFAGQARISLPELQRELTRPGLAEARAELKAGAQATSRQAAVLARGAGRVTRSSASAIPRKFKQRANRDDIDEQQSESEDLT